MMRKIINYFKIIIYAFTVIIAFLGLITSFLGIILYFIAGFKIDILVGVLGWFIISIILSYFVTKYRKIWDDYYENREVIAPEIPIKFETGFRVFLYVVSFLFLYNYLKQFLGPFPETITKDVAVEILKLISQINGVLIGFLGVALSQMYKSNIRRHNPYAVFITFTSFIISIFYCISNMTKLNGTLYTKEIITSPLIFLLCGLCIFILFILNYSLYSNQQARTLMSETLDPTEVSQIPEGD